MIEHRKAYRNPFDPLSSIFVFSPILPHAHTEKGDYFLGMVLAKNINPFPLGTPYPGRESLGLRRRNSFPGFCRSDAVRRHVFRNYLKRGLSSRAEPRDLAGGALLDLEGEIPPLASLGRNDKNEF